MLTTDAEFGFGVNSPREVTLLCNFSFLTEMTMEIILSSCKNSGADIFPNKKVTHSYVANYAVLRTEDKFNLQLFFRLLDDSGSMLGKH